MFKEEGRRAGQSSMEEVRTALWPGKGSGDGKGDKKLSSVTGGPHVPTGDPAVSPTATDMSPGVTGAHSFLGGPQLSWTNYP